MTLESMDVDPTRLPRRQEEINVLSGIFLKSVYFLDRDLTKSVIVGIFKNRGDSLGILFRGKKSNVFFSYDLFNQFAVHFNDITVALETKKRLVVRLDSGEDMRVMPMWGTHCVSLRDKEHSVTLNTFEWSQFTNNLPLVNRCLRDLFMSEEFIKDFLRQAISSEEEFVLINTELPCPVVDRLIDEIQYYKRWPNGGGSS